MANRVAVDVKARGAKQARTEVTDLKTAFVRMREEVDKSTQSYAKGALIAKGVTTGLQLVGRAVGAVTDLVGEATDSFIEDEKSQALLRTSLRANVDAWDGNADAIERVLQERIKLGFADEDQRESLKGLVAAYGDVNKALEVQRTAMDLARFSGVDLATATDTLVRVHAGNYRALKALGINTKDVTNETEALAAVQKIATGQAEAYTRTIEGRLTVATVKAAEATEKLGAKTAELSADFEEAKANGFEAFATGLDTVADGLNIGSQSFERQIELERIAIGLVPLLSDQQRKNANAALDAALRQHQLADAMSDLSHFPGKLADDMGVYTAKTAAAAKATGWQTTALREMASAFQKTTGSVNDQIDALEKLDRAGQAQKAIDALEEWRKATGKLNHEQQKLYDLLIGNYRRAKMLAGVTFAGGGLIFTGIPTTHRAAGGPLAAGQASVVGEKGPEVFVPKTAGTVIPNGATSGGSSITINVTAPALTPGSAEALARYLEPIITRAQQRRGQLSGARAF